MNDDRKHYATTRIEPETWQVFLDGELLTESNRVIGLREHYDGQDFAAVLYFPQVSVTALLDDKTERSTHCPIKGDAAYWSYRGLENSIWSYPDPHAGVEDIKNHYAFDQSQGFELAVKS